jgi:hypothetical protein
VAVTVKQLIEKLQELPDDWEICATKSGRSLEVHEPAPMEAGAWLRRGHRYGYVFTDTDRPIRFQVVRG